jgi:hypothetical protein
MMADALAENHFRYERKFATPCLSEDEAEVAIKNNPFMFDEIYHERRVNNIYLDSLGMDSYFGNVMGYAERTKIRVRWYGDSPDAARPTLELKVKRGLVGTKLSYPLPPFSLGQLGLDEMKEMFRRAKLPDWLEEKLGNQRFALYNSYKRKYFLSACKEFRATLDSELRYAGVMQQDPLALSGERPDFRVIVEVKYANEADARGVTTHFPFRMTKSSKYVTGIDLFRG